MDLNGKKVLVTGHNGFLGHHLVKELKKYNANVVTLSDKNGSIDVREWEKIKQIDGLDNIFHLAAVSYIPKSFEDPRRIYEVNVLGTLNILELARLNDVDKMVFTSSYVYGKPEYLPIDEEHPLNPNNPYSRSKLMAESICRSYYEDFGLNCIIFRPFNIYGEGQKEHFLIPTIIKQLKNERIELKDSTPKRDFINVHDVVKALLKAGSSSYDFDIFNVGYGKSYSVKEIVDKIISSHGKELEVKFGFQRRKSEIDDTVADIDKIQKKLGWKPEIDIDSGLSNLLKPHRTK